MSPRIWWAGFSGVTLALIGFWGPWVPHQAAALALSGWDLTEFAKILPNVSAVREIFYLPVWSGAALLGLLAYHVTHMARSGAAFRASLFAVALVLMTVILPPYPDILNGYGSSEFRWRFVLGAAGLLTEFGFLLVLHWPSWEERCPVPWLGGMLVVLALLGCVPALWQFLTVRQAIEAVYSARLGWGWGLGVFVAGWALVGATGGWLLIPQRQTKT